MNSPQKSTFKCPVPDGNHGNEHAKYVRFYQSPKNTSGSGEPFLEKIKPERTGGKNQDTTNSDVQKLSWDVILGRSHE